MDLSVVRGWWLAQHRLLADQREAQLYSEQVFHLVWLKWIFQQDSDPKLASKPWQDYLLSPVTKLHPHWKHVGTFDKWKKDGKTHCNILKIMWILTIFNTGEAKWGCQLEDVDLPNIEKHSISSFLAWEMTNVSKTVSTFYTQPYLLPQVQLVVTFYIYSMYFFHNGLKNQTW